MNTSLEPTQITFDKFLVDLSKEVQEPKPLISLNDIPLFTRGNISCISGKAKSRKTFLTGLFSSQFLKLENDVNIIIFDTEQAKYHVHKATKRIHRLLEWGENQNNDHLRVFNLREVETDKRRDFVKLAIEHFRPDLVFIDGMRDLIYNFNDITESSNIVNMLMKLSSETNCHICAVLHENKGDDSLRGHTGTELQNKAETVISVKANDNVSIVSPKFCRNMPFEKFNFRINADGLPEYCEPEIMPKWKSELKVLFDEILPTGVTLSYTELKKKAMEKGLNEKTMERKIKEATEQSIIIKDETTKKYHIYEEEESE